MNDYVLVIKRNNVEKYSCFYVVRNTEDFRTKIETEFEVEYLTTVGFKYGKFPSIKVDYIFAGMNGLLVIVSEFVILD